MPGIEELIAGGKAKAYARELEPPCGPQRDLRLKIHGLYQCALRLLIPRNARGVSWAHDLMADDYTYAHYERLEGVLTGHEINLEIAILMLNELLSEFEPGYAFVQWDGIVVYEPDPSRQKALEAERDAILAQLAKCRARLNVTRRHSYVED